MSRKVAGRLFGLGCLAATLAGCVTEIANPTQIHGQFMVGYSERISGPIANFEADFHQAVRNPAHTQLVIYNHGTNNSGRFQKCKPESKPDIIDVIPRAIKGTVVYYLCSNEIGRGTRGGIHEQTSYKRGQELVRVMDRFIALGIKPKNIVLAGHSGGASAVLAAAAFAPEKFNAYLISAPGYGYAYLPGHESDPLFQRLREGWQELSDNGARSVPGIIYAYPNDSYTPLKHMDFLRGLPAVDFRVTGNKPCGVNERHLYFWTECFTLAESGTVMKFLQAAQLRALASDGDVVANRPDIAWPFETAKRAAAQDRYRQLLDRSYSELAGNATPGSDYEALLQIYLRDYPLSGQPILAAPKDRYHELMKVAGAGSLPALISVAERMIDSVSWDFLELVDPTVPRHRAQAVIALLDKVEDEEWRARAIVLKNLLTDLYNTCPSGMDCDAGFDQQLDGLDRNVRGLSLAKALTKLRNLYYRERPISTAETRAAFADAAREGHPLALYAAAILQYKTGAYNKNSIQGDQHMEMLIWLTMSAMNRYAPAADALFRYSSRNQLKEIESSDKLLKGLTNLVLSDLNLQAMVSFCYNETEETEEDSGCFQHSWADDQQCMLPRPYESFDIRQTRIYRDCRQRILEARTAS